MARQASLPLPPVPQPPPAGGRVGDLVEVPRVRTVVQLADRHDPALRDELLSSFVLTEEVAFNLVAILSAVGSRKGRGFFLQGNFGSGKSHFLAVLGFLLDNPEAWRHLPVQGTPLGAMALNLAGRRVMPVPVSLVEHGSRERLEDIVLEAVAAEFSARGLEPPARPRFPADFTSSLLERYGPQAAAFASAEGLGGPEELFAAGREEALERFLASAGLPFRARQDRREAFEGLRARLEAAGYSGAALLVDELSEYLRSKSDARGFNEEIRFLQFLGEYGDKNPFWIVASLQERIEDTGEITQSAFNKIKDRYPGRLALTGKHLEALIARRLLPKKPGAAPRLAELYRQHSRAFSGFDPGQDRFSALYPVHPATLFFLEELKTLFSQHRGVVDFISARVGGDPAKAIPGLLAEPDTSLLTPETVFDHFQVRIKEMVETNPFLEVVYRYFETEAPRLFPDLAQAALALRLVKLMVLGAISPIRRDFSVTELSEMLLHRVTAVSPEVNYQYVADVLERLRTGGAYLTAEKREGAFRDVYRIDLEADVNLVIRRRVAYLRSTLFPDDTRIYTRLAAMLDAPHLPLASLTQSPRRRAQTLWQCTRREGYVIYVPPEELTPEKAAAIEEELSAGESDFVLAILPPGAEGRLARVTLPPWTAVWEPAALGPEEREELAMVLARALLLDEQAAQSTSLAGRVRRQLELELAGDGRRVRELFERAYFGGKLHLPGGKAVEPGRWGYLPLDQAVDRAASLVLEQRYPGHMAIAPQTSVFVREREGDLIEGFFKPGGLDPSQPGARALAQIAEGYLRPLGVVKRAGARLVLAADARKSDPVRTMLDLVPEGGRAELAGLYRTMRKGPLGMSREQFRLLLLSMVFSGQLSLHSDGKRLSGDRLTAFWIERATEVSKGDLAPAAVRAVLAEVPFVTAVRKSGDQFNTSVQQAAWEELATYKRAAVESRANLEAGLAKALTLPSLAELGLGRARADLDSWGGMLDEILVSYAPREGLERFATHWGGTPGLREALARLERLGEFLQGGPERFVAAAAYVRHPGLTLDGDPPAQGSGAADSKGAAGQSCREALAQLRSVLADPELPFRAGGVAELTGAFERFLAAYGPLYASHHERQYSAARFEPLRRLRSGREYGLLSALAAALGEGAGDEFPRLSRLLASTLARACRAFDPVALKVAPVCRCGLTLDSSVDLPDAAALQAALESTLADAVRLLQGGRMREAVTAYIAGLREAGRGEPATLLESLLALDPVAGELAGQLETMLAGGLAGLLREALSGRLAVVTRDLDTLVELLLDRSFEPADLLAAVEHWMGEVPRGALVRVRSGRTGKEDLLVSIVEEAFPDLLATLAELGEEAFLELVWLARWLQKLGLPAAHLDTLLERPAVAEHAEAAAGLALHLLEHHADLASRFLEQLERRLVAEGRAGRLVTLAVGGRDREGLLAVIAADSLMGFVPREALGLYVRNLADEERSVLERTLAGPAGGAFRAALAAVSSLELTLRECERACDRTLAAGDWEALYRQSLGHLQLRLLEASEALQALDVEASLPAARVKDCVGRLDAAFRDCHRKLLPALAAGGPGTPLTPAALATELLPRLTKRLAPAAAVLVVVDAMRHDFLEVLARDVLPLAQGTFRHVETLTSWALTPTLTAPNMEALLTGKRPSAGGPAADGEEEAPPPRVGRAALEEFQERSGTLVVKYNALDDRLHAARDDLQTLYRESAMALAPALLPFLDRLAPRTLILFTADHGFRERGRGPANPRYAHGGGSPFEVLVPVGVYLKV
jgi:hypothetical protein